MPRSEQRQFAQEFPRLRSRRFPRLAYRCAGRNLAGELNEIRVRRHRAGIVEPAGQYAEQRRLAAAVAAHKSQLPAGIQPDGKIFEYIVRRAVVADRNVTDIDNRHNRLRIKKKKDARENALPACPTHGIRNRPKKDAPAPKDTPRGNSPALRHLPIYPYMSAPPSSVYTLYHAPPPSVKLFSRHVKAGRKNFVFPARPRYAVTAVTRPSAHHRHNASSCPLRSVPFRCKNKFSPPDSNWQCSPLRLPAPSNFRPYTR